MRGTGFFDKVYVKVIATDKLNPMNRKDIHSATEEISLDNEAPYITSAFGYAESDTIYFNLNEPVASSDIDNLNNYSLTQNLSIRYVQSGNKANQYRLALNTGQTLPMDEVTLTIATISDLYGNVSTNQSYSFTGGDVNVPPTVRIENIPAEVSGDVYIEYTITDPENNTVSLSVHYSTDGGTTWNNASILGNITDLSSDKFTGAFFWESRLDFPSARVENVILRIIPQDRKEGTPYLSNTFTIDNNLPPSVSLSIPDSDSLYFDTVSISYTLTDAENDVLSIYASYSLDGGKTYKTATVTGQLSGIEQENYSGTLLWNTVSDYPNLYGQILFKVLRSTKRTESPTVF